MGFNLQTLKDIRSYFTKELNGIYTEHEISALVNIIIKTVIGVTRLHQLNTPDYLMNNLQKERISEICSHLKTGMPLQYILGETVFFGYKIKVTPATLIPRQETEELVDLIIKENREFSGEILDIGTGSGCIAIALASNLPGALISGMDISGAAIAVAKENAVQNNVAVNFFEGDIFNPDSERINKYGIIGSNPPYVRNSEKIYMSKNVIDFEPHTALFVDDTDPLVYYRGILSFAEKTQLAGRKVYFEINEAMGPLMVQLLLLFGYSEVQIIKDLNGKDRFVKGKKNE
jgi:release factor glutamine methyltransferase